MMETMEVKLWWWRRNCWWSGGNRGEIVVDRDGGSEIVIDGGSGSEIVDDGDDDGKIVVVMEWGEGNNGGIMQRY